MSSVDRRRFLALLGSSAALTAVDTPLAAQRSAPAAAEDFNFIFLTDTHIQPELDASKGCAMAFRKMRDVRADFAIQGGDHVFDALAVAKQRSISLFDLYDKTQQDLSLKVYHTIGNHDCLGLTPQSGVTPSDPLYGKRYFEEHVSKTYYSFDHKGVHFIVLDSIGFTPDRSYEGRIDSRQLAWLKSDLAAQPAARPIIVAVHIPLVSAVDNYLPVPATPPPHHGMTVINSSDVTPLFEGHNVLAVLQGHTHINERVEWQGVPYITSGAVCGNWWRGTRLGTQEGFTVVSIRNGKLTTRYETYGFHSVDPQNT
jgi:3',5'-cyclic AMP phosphodiesterase CpdA